MSEGGGTLLACRPNKMVIKLRAIGKVNQVHDQKMPDGKEKKGKLLIEVESP